ncbi:ATPase [Sphingomonas sp.]|uniref:F0F1 ATP synthase subunit B family protein n=1 Tax=Sphingomonas sp. TaxID=28214 RepID=UPI0025D408D2|nr:ATPase [Sphingomonas sp.]
MPQLSQLSDVVLSQLFWLLLVLGFIYFAIGRNMVPKIQSTVDARDKHIADNLAAADRARTEADAIENAYRARMDESRLEAATRTAAVKRKAAIAAEKRVSEAGEAIAATSAEDEGRIRASRAAAAAGIQATAAELAQDIAGKLAGVTVSKAQAVEAVKASFHG